MRSYGTTERTEDNEQTTVSAQKNAIFSSQRFYGVKKELREEAQLYALKNLNVFIEKQRFHRKTTNIDKV